MSLDPTASSFTPTNPDDVPTSTSTPTPTSSDTTPLFSLDLISPTVLSLLPPSYTMRPLRRTDFHNNFLDVLRVLTSVGDVSAARWHARYDWMVSQRDSYFILVVLDGSDKIVGTGALVVERKFIHNLGSVGHIEDIAVARDQQGKKLGLRIIQALDFVAEGVGCYKVSSFLCLEERMGRGCWENGMAEWCVC